ncbi:GGDEF domain-containing protein [Gallaecimonas pentaromativorans]|uniref:GGDEF domain-containing protein n=1 Tax=Gallaecimonas pentaromativorans TaxID=584787 RepID=UPI003A909ADB
MQIDLIASLFSLAVLLILMGLWMLAASFTRDEAHRQQMRLWALANLVMGIAYGLFSSRLTLPLSWTLVVANFLLALAYGAYAVALASLFGQRHYLLIKILSISLGTFALYYFEIIRSDDSYRILLLAGLTLVVWTLALLHCIGAWRQQHSPHVIFMTLTLASLILVSLTRLLAAWYSSDFGYQTLPDFSAIIKTTTFVLILAPPLLTVGFFMICADYTQQRFKTLANLDSLTGINNRRATLALAEQALANQYRHGGDLCCVMMDIDHFKNVNDNHGHAVGDEVLKKLTALVQGRIRRGDIFGRLGGEEFALFLPNADEAQAAKLADTLRQAIADTHITTTKGGALQVTVSFGVAQRRHRDEPLSQLLSRADSALYEAKHQGRNRVVVM